MFLEETKIMSGFFKHQTCKHQEPLSESTIDKVLEVNIFVRYVTCKHLTTSYGKIS